MLPLSLPTALALALAAPVPALAADSLSAFPEPGSEVASPYSELSFRGASRGKIGAVRVRGSRSGRHAGRWRRHSDGRGASFVPRRPFRPGERVSVRTYRQLLGARSGDYSFQIANVPSRIGPPQIVVPPNNNPDVVTRYRSRRDLAPARLKVTARRPGTAPGYLFLAPKKGPGQSGPLIADDSGAPMWFLPMPGRIKAADFRVQRYRGDPVLTWWQGRIAGGEGRGEAVIMDTSYRRIARVRAGNGYAADLHEFEITPRGTALLLIYQPVLRDLRSKGSARQAQVTDNIVQEIDIRTGRVLFEWHSLDHVGINASRFPVPESPRTSWDYFHVNSVASDADGDVIVSARHTWAAYKIDRSTGRVLWQLGGRGSSFRMGPGTEFAWQHDARRSPDGTVSVFDNAAAPPVRDRSRALSIRLDERARTATLSRSASHPNGLLAASQGNSQVLANGNVFVGWGSRGSFSEFAPDGTLLLDGELPSSSDTYRAFRHRWVGHPPTQPRLAARRRADGSTLWVSWNGATEVRRWVVLAGRSPRSLRRVATAPRRGFETRIDVPVKAAHVAVRALDAGSRTLGRSTVVKPSR
jgi:hypothetical protein